EEDLQRRVGDQSVDLSSGTLATVLVVGDELVAVLNPDTVGTSRHAAVVRWFGQVGSKAVIGSGTRLISPTTTTTVRTKSSLKRLQTRVSLGGSPRKKPTIRLLLSGTEA